MEVLLGQLKQKRVFYFFSDPTLNILHTFLFSYVVNDKFYIFFSEYPNYYISDNYNCGNLTCGGDGFRLIRFCDYFLYDCSQNQKSCALTPECINGNTISYSCANVDCYNAQCYLTRHCDKSSPTCKPKVNCNPFNNRNN